MEPRSSVDTTRHQRLNVTGPIHVDSTLYAGPVFGLEATNELYTTLYFKDEKEHGAHEMLVKQADSLVYQTDEVKRHRLPLDVAQRYFNLTGLSAITVFDKNHQQIGVADFARVEYLEDMIEGQFIAVFKSGSDRSIDSAAYAIGQCSIPYNITNLRSRKFDDEELNKVLLKKLDLAYPTRVFYHTELSPDYGIYSLIAGDSLSLIVELRDDTVHVLKDIRADYFIGDIQPIAMEKNGKPVLVATLTIPETDALWHALLIFSGSAYETAEASRFVPDP